jgi:hypothetical protein
MNDVPMYAGVGQEKYMVDLPNFGESFFLHLKQKFSCIKSTSP